MGYAHGEFYLIICAVTFSDDGIHWCEPIVTLGADESTGWEDDINRNCVLKIDGIYKMWYTGQARGYSYIGYAESADGVNWRKSRINPIFVNNRSNVYEQERIGGSLLSIGYGCGANGTESNTVMARLPLKSLYSILIY